MKAFWVKYPALMEYNYIMYILTLALVLAMEEKGFNCLQMFQGNTLSSLDGCLMTMEFMGSLYLMVLSQMIWTSVEVTHI